MQERIKEILGGLTKFHVPSEGEMVGYITEDVRSFLARQILQELSKGMMGDEKIAETVGIRLQYGEGHYLMQTLAYEIGIEQLRNLVQAQRIRDQAEKEQEIGKIMGLVTRLLDAAKAGECPDQHCPICERKWAAIREAEELLKSKYIKGGK